VREAERWTRAQVRLLRELQHRGERDAIQHQLPTPPGRHPR
jgi:hypothetical protein